MNNKVLKFIKNNNMIASGDGIIVGLSGGADSVCLLHLLCSFRDALNIKVGAAHLNHMLRGQEAERDENYCKKLCQSLDLPFYSKRMDISTMAQQQGISFEQCGRNARYAFFDEVAQQYGYNKVATAHTLSDSVETFLFNFMRGTGTKGLCGIPLVRNSIIRPLLSCTREEIEQYCQSNNLQYMTDSTNLSDDYSRNFIRHNIVAQLKNKNQSFEQAAYRTMSMLRADEQYLDEISSQIYDHIVCDNGINCSRLKDENISIRTRVLYKYFKHNDIEVDYKTISKADEIITAEKGKINLPADKALAAKNGIAKITVQRENEDAALQNESQILAVLQTKHLGDNNKYIDIFDKKRLCVNKYNKNSTVYLKNINKNLFHNFINYDMINGDIIIRTRKQGDCFRPKSKGCTKSLKKLFNEAKIPPNERNQLIIAQDDVGIIWVEGFGADTRVAPDNNTENLIGLFLEERS